MCQTNAYLDRYVFTQPMSWLLASLGDQRPWYCPWWRNQMETFSALLAICAENSPVPGEFPHKGQWRGALMFSLICVWINGWVNNRKAGDLRRYRIHYDAIVMQRKMYGYMSWTNEDCNYLCHASVDTWSKMQIPKVYQNTPASWSDYLAIKMLLQFAFYCENYGGLGHVNGFLQPWCLIINWTRL